MNRHGGETRKKEERMLAEERFALILEQLNRKRTVTVQEPVSYTHLTLPTITAV